MPHAPAYKGTPAERLFAALHDADPAHVIDYIRRGEISGLVCGLLIRTGLFNVHESIRRQYIHIFETCAILQSADRFQSTAAAAFRADVEALRESTKALIESINHKINPITALRRSETHPESA